MENVTTTTTTSSRKNPSPFNEVVRTLKMHTHWHSKLRAGVLCFIEHWVFKMDVNRTVYKRKWVRKSERERVKSETLHRTQQEETRRSAVSISDNSRGQYTYESHRPHIYTYTKSIVVETKNTKQKTEKKKEEQKQKKRRSAAISNIYI